MKIDFDIRIDDREVQAAFSRLLQAGEDLTPAMRAMGEHMINTTRERFRDEEARSRLTERRGHRCRKRRLSARSALSGSNPYVETLLSHSFFAGTRDAESTS